MIIALLSDQRVLKASTISIFVSFGSEINTIPLIEGLLNIGKKVVVPSITPTDEMIMKEIKSLDDLSEVGKYGIKEALLSSKIIGKMK